jgi:hypothetical protein
VGKSPSVKKFSVDVEASRPPDMIAAFADSSGGLSMFALKIFPKNLFGKPLTAPKGRHIIACGNAPGIKSLSSS